jgi:hypothetical protein
MVGSIKRKIKKIYLPREPFEKKIPETQYLTSKLNRLVKNNFSLIFSLLWKKIFSIASKKLKKATSVVFNFFWRRFSEKIKAFRDSGSSFFIPVFVFIPASPGQPGAFGRA